MQQTVTIFVLVLGLFSYSAWAESPSENAARSSREYLAPPLRPLYPEVEPFHSGHLKVSDTHHLYFEESGNLGGLPVLMLHGGPGGWVTTTMRRLYDPKKYRIILYEQRGCGRSTPFGELRQNTTQDLVDDIVRLLDFLKIHSSIVSGGSWGSTLALLYALQHRDRVEGLVLRGVFLGRAIDQHLDYGTGEGSASEMFPEQWAKLAAHLPPDRQGDLIGYLYDVYNAGTVSADKDTLLHAFEEWENFLSGYEPTEPSEPIKPMTATRLTNLRTTLYYEKNGFFIQPWADKHLMPELYRLRGIPTRVVHGEKDLLCSALVAREVSARIGGVFERVPGAGHGLASSETMMDALIRATEAVTP